MQLQLNPDQSERISYQSADLPVRAVQSRLSVFADYAAACHCHHDLEFLRVDQGTMDYFVNGQIVHIAEGEIIFVNSGRLHYGFSAAREDCRFSCMLFHPSLLGEMSLPTRQYFEGVISETKKDALLLTKADAVACSLFEDIMTCCQQRSAFYELRVQSDCILLVQQLCALLDASKQEGSSDESWKVLRRMVAYVQANYAEPITLQDIASSGALCRSGCCQIFRERLGTSPMRFLTRYRLEHACSLLQNGQTSITEIAHACGFSGSNYFTEQFHRSYGMSPSAFRAQTQGTKMLESGEAITDTNCYYICRNSRTLSDLPICTKHSILRQTLEKIVLDDLQRVIGLAKTNEKKFANMLLSVSKRESEREVQKAKRELAEARTRIETLDRIVGKLYEDNAEGKINDERFATMLAGYEEEQSGLRGRCTELEALIATSTAQTDSIESFLGLVRRYTEIKELTPEIVHEFIDKVLVGEPDYKPGRYEHWARIKTQEVRIIYNFIGDVSESLKEGV